MRVDVGRPGKIVRMGTNLAASATVLTPLVYPSRAHHLAVWHVQTNANPALQDINVSMLGEVSDGGYPSILVTLTGASAFVKDDVANKWVIEVTVIAMPRMAVLTVGIGVSTNVINTWITE